MTDQTATAREEAARLHAQAERAEADTLWSAAAAAYEACLSLVSAADDRLGFDEAALLTGLGRCYWNLSEARSAWRTLRRAIALYQERGDGAGHARATIEVLRIWGPPERQRAMAQDALDALGDADPYLRAKLLLRLRWADDDGEARFDEAMAIAEEHRFEDILAARVNKTAWEAFDAGDVKQGIALQRAAFDTFARLNNFDEAAMTLRGAAFATLEQGHLDAGLALALETVEYARRVHLRFTEELALVDAAGVLFARCDYDGCIELLSQLNTNTDFRADLYRMWILELKGDTRGALAMLVNPDRAGGALTAISQTHGAAAGILYRAGNVEAAREELRAWFDVAQQDRSLWLESAALSECIVALGDDALVAAVDRAFSDGLGARACYATLQGRALAPARGAVALRLGKLDAAERAYADGVDWCAREGCAVDEGVCVVGLADVARQRGDDEAARRFSSRAASIFEQHGARLYLDRIAPPGAPAASA